MSSPYNDRKTVLASAAQVAPGQRYIALIPIDLHPSIDSPRFSVGSLFAIFLAELQEFGQSAAEVEFGLCHRERLFGSGEWLSVLTQHLAWYRIGKVARTDSNRDNAATRPAWYMRRRVDIFY